MESGCRDMIESLIELARQEPTVDVLWLYGSRAKGGARPDSDYDLAVAFNRFADDRWERRLQSELLAQRWSDAMGVGEGVLSVVDINLAPLPLAFAVVTQGRALLVKDSLRLAREENRITSMWEVDHEYHKRHYG